MKTWIQLLVAVQVVAFAVPLRAQPILVPFEHALVVSGGGFEQVLVFGQDTEASGALDPEVDLPAPPAFPTGFDARLIRSGSGPVTQFFSDLRALAASDTFFVHIRPESSADNDVTIRWESLPGFPGEIALEIDGATENLAEAGSLTLTIEEEEGIEGFIRYSNAFSVSIEHVDETVPAQYRLEANYPNPFNPTTLIPFGLAASHQVRLAIYDAVGREVAVLVDQFMEAGRYEVQWHAGGVASGVYLYRITAGSFTASRTLTLVQ